MSIVPLVRTVNALVVAAAIVASATAHPTVAQDVQVAAQHASGGCTLRDGPGDVSQNCINVKYTTGVVNRVNEINGSIQAGKAPAFPATVCNVTFEMWGTLSTVARYRVSHNASGCQAVSIGAFASGIDQPFKRGTKICSRSLWEGKWSNPACVSAP